MAEDDGCTAATAGPDGEAVRVAPEELATLFLFEQVGRAKLEKLSALGRVARFPAGATVYTEGAPGACFYVLLEGTIALNRRVRGGGEVEVVRTDHRGSYFGALLTLIDKDATGDPPYANSAVAVSDCRLFVLPASVMVTWMASWYPMAMHLIQGIYGTMRVSQIRVSERENLMSLGRLTAGLTHELNNPAAAAVRAGAELRERTAAMRRMVAEAAQAPDPGALAALLELQEEAVAAAAGPCDLSPLTVSDREDELADWLEDRGVADAPGLAAVLVGAGLDAAWARSVAERVGAAYLPAAMAWLGNVVETETLLAENAEAVARISDLIGTAKQYTQLDRAPDQRADVHVLLDSTLAVLRHKTGPGVKVVRDYDRTLPELDVSAAELNQAWTNIIDNALYAMGGSGTLTVRTRRDHRTAVVEIGDTGPGLAPGAADRLFEPFFTTKPPQEGTGLGLDIAWRIVVDRHRGDIRVASEPGDTRFTVCLPLPAPGI
jgi:signal transduction histidine kinase